MKPIGKGCLERKSQAGAARFVRLPRPYILAAKDSCNEAFEAAEERGQNQKKTQIKSA